MNKLNYKYCILKYKHSAKIDEQINIGVIIYFPINNKLIFKYSNNLNRIKSIYSLNSEKIIHHYLSEIDKKCKIFSRNIISDIFDFDLREFIKSNIFAENESSLQFTKTFSSFSRNNIEEKVSDNLSIELLSIKTKGKKLISRNTITNKFYNNLSVLSLDKFEKKHLFYKDYKVENEDGLKYNFDYAWQNGSLNLVKSLDLDVKTPSSLMNKAYNFFGLFTDLSDEAERLNLRYDLFAEKPSKKELFKNFDHSIKLLDNLDSVNIILDEDIDKYSDKAIKVLRSKISH